MHENFFNLEKSTEKYSIMDTFLMYKIRQWKDSEHTLSLNSCRHFICPYICKKWMEQSFLSIYMKLNTNTGTCKRILDNFSITPFNQKDIAVCWKFAKNFLKYHKNWLNSVILMSTAGSKANFISLFYLSYKSKFGDQVMPYVWIKSVYTIWIWNNLHHYIH